MGVSINLKSSGRESAKIERLWEKIGRLEFSPSMKALNYPPHFTFAIYDEISAGPVLEVLAQATRGLRPIEIAFSRVGSFGTNPNIIWAGPEDGTQLENIHALIHSGIDPLLCRTHYRPGNWTPHCTLGTKVPPENRKTALSLLLEEQEPISVTFDTIDCVQFHPIAVVQDFPLRNRII